MAYNKEYKQKILEQMKTKKIDEIAKETGISKATLFRALFCWILSNSDFISLIKGASKISFSVYCS